jgi:putative hydrolase of the HAD superfamily
MPNLLNFDVVVFDLDDTLYSEMDYVLSGYKFLSGLIEKLYLKNTYKTFLEASKRNETDVFSYVIGKHKLPETLKHHLILAYRYHVPTIQLNAGAITILEKLKSKNIPIYLITDGRGITQRLKITSLGVETFFEKIFISEEVGVGKPEPDSFIAIKKMHPNQSIVYVADNPKKDFISPNELGWSSIGILNKATRVHPLTNNYIEAADVWLDELKELTC